MSGAGQNPSPIPSGPPQTLGNTVEGPAGFRLGSMVPTKYETSFQDPEQAAHDRQMAAEEAAHIRAKELSEISAQNWVRGVIVALLMVVAASCLVVILAPGYAPSTVDRSIGILVAIVSGFVGYLTGKK